MDEEEKKQGFKVEDKRRFDDRGNAREAAEEENRREQGQEKPREADARLEKAAAGAEATSGDAPEINFASFVMSLATQALIQLGEMPAPDGFDIAPDRLAARQTIEILKMLQQKTKGNLDANEENLMGEILHTLQMSFVRSK